MTRMRKMLATIATGIVIIVIAGIAGVVLNGVRLAGPAEGLSINAGGDVERAPYAGDPTAEAALVASEQERIDYVKSIGPSVEWQAGVDGPYRVPTMPASTLVLTPRTEPYTLVDLQELAPDTFAAQPDGSYLLSENVLALAGASLDLSSQTPAPLKLLSSPAAFVSIVTLGGGLTVRGAADRPATFTGYDPGTGAADTVTADGRAYIRVIGGPVAIEHAAFDSLGFWAGDTGGLALTGADAAAAQPVDAAAAASDVGGAPTLSGDDLTQLTADDQLQPGAVTGTISDVSATGNAFGLFVSTATKLAISGTRAHDSLVDGIVMHRSVTDSTIDASEATGSGGDGIVLARSSSGITVTGVTVSGNGRNGISIDGRPLVDGPSANGTPLGEYGDVRVAGSTVAGNARYGIQVTGGHAITVTDTHVTANIVGIAVDHGASDVKLAGNALSGQERQSISIGSGVNGSEISDNRFASVDTGVRIRGGSAIVDGNTFTDITNHAVTLVGRATGTRVTDNTVAGHGSTPFHDDATGGYFARNDTEGWDKPVTAGSVVKTTIAQPLTLVWAALGLLLLVTAITGYRRRGTRDASLERRPLVELSRGIVSVEELRGGKS